MSIESQRADGFPVFYAASAADWRAYLSEHHNKVANTWLVLFKKNSQQPSLSYEEARDEALCFGWIDSKPNKRDAESYYLFFAKRNPKSNWSRVHKERVLALEAAGKLDAAGIDMIVKAKASGTWTALDEVEDRIVPADMEAVFQRIGGEARKNWNNFPPSVQRGILEWIFNAKRPATRANRIEQTVDMASRNERANQWR
ncbi:MAG: YdeI/OmpD-associated family protein [Bacteroidota bacterium]